MKDIKELTPDELRAELEKARESRDHWMDMASKSEARLKAFKEMVKNVIILIE